MILLSSLLCHRKQDKYILILIQFQTKLLPRYQFDNHQNINKTYDIFGVGKIYILIQNQHETSL